MRTRMLIERVADQINLSVNAGALVTFVLGAMALRAS